ncbi:hypothetical protein IFM89_000125 [Coptis chinensis]|uniref:Pentatricopeptide repeat-containing protein n=1 Tax=Coptis chinensis TaxID=261450 RepID=A0A835LTP9_9MAGN|nr:hypothetical protein IFM89_000125 [Coptis chinensis]
MEVNGVKPDCMTLVSALSACARLGCLQIGNEIDKFIVEGEFRSNMFINNARLDLYAKCGDMNVARTIFDEMSKRNVVSWSIMIGGYAGGQILSEDALFLFGLFSSSKECVLKPSLHTIHILKLLQNVSEAGEIYEEIGKLESATSCFMKLGNYEKASLLINPPLKELKVFNHQQTDTNGKEQYPSQQEALGSKEHAMAVATRKAAAVGNNKQEACARNNKQSSSKRRTRQTPNKAQRHATRPKEE